MQQFLSIPEVQSFLGIKSRKTILRYITAGKLRAYKIGGTRWRIAASDVVTFLRAEFTTLAGPAPEPASAPEVDPAESVPSEARA